LRSPSPPLSALTVGQVPSHEALTAVSPDKFFLYYSHTSHHTSTTGNETRSGTPTSEQEPLSESSSQLCAKCIEAISVFQKGKCTTLDKVRAIRAITDILSSASPPLSETEINDSLEAYL
jgi:hypothetical protein